MTKHFKILLLTLLLAAIGLNAESLRIEPDYLSKNINSYKILDTRTEVVYKEGHIKGALNFPIGLTYEHINNNGKLTNPVKMQKILQRLGLTTDSKIVVYDNGDFFDASRLFWTLEVYGFTNVKLLNTGYDNWDLSSYPISTNTPTIEKSNYISKINNSKLATKFTTQIATKNPNQIIIDARAEIAYEGKKSSAKRFGHIPSAQNFPASHNINYEDNTQKLQTISKLKEIYKNVDKSKKIVLYCAVGRIAATNYFALRELDYDVANYDASWKEWGNDNSLPIITLTKE
ncbi:rhodanese-like domain-containing protein [Arcobacteraceae bacterium]|nr:rhodanese-like domain-containing protein [Arcobacteraceae bacterium]